MIIRNARVLTFDPENRVLDSADIEIKPDGSIGKVGKVAARDESIDAGGRLVMPALINAHSHLYSTFARGIALEGYAPQNFSGILKKLWWQLDKALNPEDI